MVARRIALACHTPHVDAQELSAITMPSYGIRRVQAAVVADLQRPNHVVRLFDADAPDVERQAREILEFEPDILGLSIYVWSTECMVAVAREVKRRRPECLIVFGGPSARPAVFDLPPFQEAKSWLDVLVEGDGEIIFRAIARLPDLNSAALEKIAGLTLPAQDVVGAIPRQPVRASNWM